MLVPPPCRLPERTAAARVFGGFHCVLGRHEDKKKGRRKEVRSKIHVNVCVMRVRVLGRSHLKATYGFTGAVWLISKT